MCAAGQPAIKWITCLNGVGNLFQWPMLDGQAVAVSNICAASSAAVMMVILLTISNAVVTAMMRMCDM
jgi:hypothetical protein